MDRVLLSMQPSQFQELLDKYSRGECTPEEIALIHDWYERIGHEDALPSDVPAEEVTAGGRIWAAVNPDPSGGKKRFSWVSRAAIISIPLLACIAFYVSRPSTDSFTTPAALRALTGELSERRFVNPGKSPIKIKLADGSKVILKAASELVVDKDFGKSQREVRLEGAAYFVVKPNPERPFVVFSNEVVTKVLGTSFSVQAYDSESEITVAVKTGKVSVFASDRLEAGQEVTRKDKDKEVILTPNQKMVYYRAIDKVSKGLVEKPEIVLPNSDLFRMQFENAEVSRIFDVLAENYGVDIRYDSRVLKQCRLTTRMSDEGLYERIEVICKAIGASYSIGDDAVIIIKSNGC